MKYFALAFVAFFLTLSAFAQQTETRDVESFDGVSAQGSFSVTLKKADKPQVKIEAENVDLDRIETKVKGGTLKLELKKGRYKNMKLHITVYYTELQEVNLAGSGDITTDGNIVGSELEINLAGSGSFIGEVAVDELEIGIAGSGNVKVNGKTDKLDVSIAGSGDFQGLKLQSNKADISIAGSGDAEVWVENRLKGAVAGSGDIRYKGKKPKVDVSTMGSGKVERL